MAPLLARWWTRLPELLASAAGAHVQIPAGNSELIRVLEPFDK